MLNLIFTNLLHVAPGHGIAIDDDLLVATHFLLSADVSVKSKESVRVRHRKIEGERKKRVSKKEHVCVYACVISCVYGRNVNNLDNNPSVQDFRFFVLPPSAL